MTRRHLLAVCLKAVGVAAAAPIPNSLKKKQQPFPCIKNASDEVLSEWADCQDQWWRLCKDQWPPLTVLSHNAKAKLDRGEDLGHELRFRMLRELRWIWNGNSLPMIDP